MPFDVLEEADTGAHCSNSICDVGPDMAFVFFSVPVSCVAEGLAWVTSSEDVHFSVKACPRESGNIRPDRCRIHETRFHFRNQVRDGIRFDFTQSDCSQSADDSLESKFNASVSGTKADVCNCFGSIHVMTLRVECVG